MTPPDTPTPKDRNDKQAERERPDAASQSMEEAQEEAAEQRADEGGYQ